MSKRKMKGEDNKGRKEVEGLKGGGGYRGDKLWNNMI